MLVVAGAGTGKTQVITRRIAWLIAQRRARPSEILALTFTDKAAEEMAVRVDQLVPYGYTDTAISTFHAFGDVIGSALEPACRRTWRAVPPGVVIFLPSASSAGPRRARWGTPGSSRPGDLFSR
jgi:hypothetical protein